MRHLSDDEVRVIRRRLVKWGRQNFRAFEWRRETDPWLTLVAQFLLQRTRAPQAEEVFRWFKEAYPQAHDLVADGVEAAGSVLKKTGLHWRAQHLYGIAVAVADRGGRPPEDMERLLSITGIGPYTAAAWLSLHRNVRAVIIDANVARLLGRIVGGPVVTDPRHVRWLQELAERITPRRIFRDYNYAALDLTMMICTPTAPKCSECPLATECDFGKHH